MFLWWIMLGHLGAYAGCFLKRQGLALELLIGKKTFFETLAERWLLAGVFHGPFGGYGGAI